MTAPHFWNADSNLVTQMNGVKPDRELHDTFLDIEPITGVALSAHKRIQVFHTEIQIKFKNYFIKGYKISLIPESRLARHKSYGLNVNKSRKQNTKFAHPPKNQRNFIHFFALAFKKWSKQKIKALDDLN